MSFFHAIQTERLTLKRIASGDESLGGPGYVPLLRHLAPLSAEANFSFAYDHAQSSTSPVYGWSFALRSAPDLPVGYVALHNCNRQEGSCELRLHLSHDLLGQTHAGEALNVLVSYCFLLHFPFRLERMTATAAEHDPRKRAMLLEIGFKEKVDQHSAAVPGQQAGLVLSFMDWELHQRVSL